MKAHRLVYHSTLGLRVMKKKRKIPSRALAGYPVWLREDDLAFFNTETRNRT